MRILLLGWGSRGDVEPFVALGLGLQRAGYDVAVAAGRDFAPWIESFGLTCERFSVDVEEIMRTGNGREWLGGSESRLAEWRLTAHAFRIMAPVLAADLVRMVRPDDFVVSSTLTVRAMVAVQRERGCGHAYASFSVGVPTRSGPASLFPPRPKRESVLNLWAGYAALVLVHQLMRAVDRATVRELGVRPLALRDYVQRARRVPVIVAVSPVLAPPPADWPETVTVTGAWQLPSPPADVIEQVVPVEVRNFLTAGHPPVYLGFGSMTSRDPQATTDLLLDAVRRAGVRAIIGRGVDRLGAEGVPADLAGRVIFIDSLPHAWLLPRCAAVVTHGGSGSTHAGLRSAKPSMAVPHMTDQHYFARRLAELGVGPASVPRQELTPDLLGRQLQHLVGNAAYATRAAEVGQAVIADQGVARAVELVRDWCAGEPAGDPTTDGTLSGVTPPAS